MLLEFLKFLNIKNKEKNKKTIIDDKNIEESEIIDSEQIYKIEDKDIIDSNNDKIRQIIEIQPMGNGKAIRRITTQKIALNRI